MAGVGILHVGEEKILALLLLLNLVQSRPCKQEVPVVRKEAGGWMMGELSKQASNQDCRISNRGLVAEAGREEHI